MGSLKITNLAVQRLAATGREQLWWDPDLSGFGVKVSARGAKAFVLQYRLGGREAKTSRFTIGSNSAWDAKQARAEAQRLLRLIAIGEDPRRAELERRRAQTDLAFACYAEEIFTALR